MLLSCLLLSFPIVYFKRGFRTTFCAWFLSVTPATLHTARYLDLYESQVPSYAVSHSISGSKHLTKFCLVGDRMLSQSHGRRIITDILSTVLLLGVTTSIFPRINQAEKCWSHLIGSFSSLVCC